MGVLKRITNGTTTESDSNLVMALVYTAFVIGTLVGIALVYFN